MKPELKKVSGGTIFRKIAMGSWRTASDPSVYGLIEVDVSKANSFLEKINKDRQAQAKVSITHLVGKALAIMLTERPEINGMIRFARVYQRKHVDLFYQVNIPGSPNDPVGKATLAGVVVRKAETLTVAQIAEDLFRKSRLTKSGGDNDLVKSMHALKWVPWQLMTFVLNLSSFINFDLGINLKWAGMPRDPFGSVMITNVGSLGVDVAWAPLVPYTKVPLLMTVGKVLDRPWVVDGQVMVRPVIRIGVTFDHRFMDGVHAAEMSRIFNQCFEDPAKYFG